MNERQVELYRRICAFEFTSPEDPKPFDRRLAQDEHWTAKFTQRAIDEYRRFTLLACTAGHTVCPSEVVDQVWHLHLIYTRSYWQRFCGDVLGQPLHHDPSRGGPDELSKHRQMYTDTLSSYQSTFDEAPPADIWPDVDSRFSGKGVTEVVDRSRYWLLPKPRWPRQLSPRAMFWMAGIGWLPLAAAPVLDVYDWRGPDFLKLYACVALVALVIGFIIRGVTRHIGSEPIHEAEELDPYELAYLSGGSGRAVNAAVARLVQGDALQMVDALPPKFRCVDLVGEDAHTLERTVCRAFAASVEGEKLASAHKAARKLFPPIEEKLREQGLLVSAAAEWIGRGVPLLIMAGVVLFAMGKMSVGLQRGKPISFLVMMTVFTVVISLVAFVRPLFRTARGNQLLNQMRHQYRDLERTARKQPQEIPAEQLAMALGLWGCGLLATTAYGMELGRREGWAGMYGGGCGGSPGSGCGGSSCGGGGGCGGGGCGGGCGGCGG